MKKYFLHNGKEHEGPFSIDDLKQKGITNKTMVWFDGIQTWTEAQFIPELKDIATSNPPPFTNANPIKQTIDKTKKVLEKDILNEIEDKIKDNSRKKIFKWSVIIFAIIGLSVVGTYLIKQTPLTNKSDGNPLDSLIIADPIGTYTFNRYHDKWEASIRVEIYNRANIYAYKDFVIEVQYLSETNTLLTTKQFTIYKLVEPLSRFYSYEILDGDVPNGTSKLKWKLIGATPIIANNRQK
jgi:hypothetical protein